MVYKYTSCKELIAKIIADLNEHESNLRILDIIEWIGEGLEKIGGVHQYLVKTTGRESIPALELENYQVELPMDFHSIIQVAYSTNETGPFYPMRYATGSFDYNPEEYDSLDTGVFDTVASANLIILAMKMYDLSYEGAIKKLTEHPEVKSLLTALLTPSTLGIPKETKTTDFVYTIKGGWLKTNLRDGYLMLAYKAIPTDEEGYPLIPDSESYKEALYWYVQMKQLYPKWVIGAIRDRVYEHVEYKWNYYRKQAYGEAMMPDKGKLEVLKNIQNRLIPNINEFDTFFSHLGEQAIEYNHAIL